MKDLTPIPGFQFHKGSIKTRVDGQANLAVLHFNSIKVRLRLALKSDTPMLVIFQFHKGSIKTWLLVGCALRY